MGSYLKIMDEFRVKANEIKASLKLSNTICHNKLSKEDYLLLEDVTSLSKGKIEKCFQLFLNHCTTGRLQKNRILEIMVLVFPEMTASIITNRIFSFFDKDGKDDIDFTEFVLGCFQWSTTSE